MPSLITHDTFGRDVYGKYFEFIGGTKNEMDAFLLGNQGPDPLFYAIASPRLMAANRLGSQMHGSRTSELLVALRRSVDMLPAPDRPIGRAYAMGFICHYLLDSTAHPLIYSYEYAFCDAGIDGLDRRNHNDVHALIESDLDVMILTVKRNKTIAQFNPSREIAKADDRVLDIIGRLYVNTVAQVFGISIPADTVKTAVKLMRMIQSLFYSPDGFKQNVLGRLEMLVKPYSFYRAMSHQNHRLPVCDFDNHDHEPWINPFSGDVSSLSFLELYDAALGRTLDSITLFDDGGFDEEAARSITHDLNFLGDFVVATIVAVEDADGVEGDGFEGEPIADDRDEVRAGLSEEGDKAAVEDA